MTATWCSRGFEGSQALIVIGIFLLAVMIAVELCFRCWWKRSRQRTEAFRLERDQFEEQKFELAEASLKLLELKEELELEKEKSNRLLHNILPDRVIADLSEKGESAPERFENVSIFFSDFVGFTETCSVLDPSEVIVELSDIFGEFDRIFVRNRCERIKTIGDAYMAVSGLPDPDPGHWRNILNAAREALAYLKERNARPGARHWEMRVGIHSGSVVGGIVGREKYIYDVFGDTVNTASRLEQSSEAMRINVSDTTRNLAEAEFKFIDRGAIQVKGKGTVAMFFLEE